jgi:hypothetical protein
LLAGDEAERTDELRQEVELLEQLRVEDAAALVGGEGLQAIGRLANAVPSDHHRARLLGFPEAEQEVREADDCARGKACRAAHRLRQRVIGAVCERVAVDRKQRRADAFGVTTSSRTNLDSCAFGFVLDFVSHSASYSA